MAPKEKNRIKRFLHLYSNFNTFFKTKKKVNREIISKKTHKIFADEIFKYPKYFKISNVPGEKLAVKVILGFKQFPRTFRPYGELPKKKFLAEQ